MGTPPASLLPAVYVKSGNSHFHFLARLLQYRFCRRIAHGDLARGLQFAIVPPVRPELAPPGLPYQDYPAREFIKATEAVYVPTIRDTSITHEYLIKAVSQQMGGAHEDDGIEPILTRISKILIGGVHPYVPVLVFDAALALQIAERILDVGEERALYTRLPRPSYGDTTLLVRLALRDTLLCPIDICEWKSDVSAVAIRCYAGAQGFTFSATKREREPITLTIPYPGDPGTRADMLFAFSYSSGHRLARLLHNEAVCGEEAACDLGWFEADELNFTRILPTNEKRVYVHCAYAYARLLSSATCGELIKLPRDAVFPPAQAISDESRPFPD